MPVVYATACSGIECVSVAVADLGWMPAWFSETDPFCRELLRQRQPGAVNLGNGMAAPVVRWICQRLSAHLDDLL